MSACIESWKASTCLVRAEAALTPPSVLSSVVSSLPLASVSVTFFGSRPSMLDATRCTIAWTWPSSSDVPGSVSMRTDAVGGSCSSVKTCFSGMARCTTAVSTPWMASTVLESSPSIARLKLVCSCDSEVDRLCLSSRL